MPASRASTSCGAGLDDALGRIADLERLTDVRDLPRRGGRPLGRPSTGPRARTGRVSQKSGPSLNRGIRGRRPSTRAACPSTAPCCLRTTGEVSHEQRRGVGFGAARTPIAARNKVLADTVRVLTEAARLRRPVLRQAEGGGWSPTRCGRSWRTGLSSSHWLSLVPPRTSAASTGPWKDGPGRGRPTRCAACSNRPSATTRRTCWSTAPSRSG